MMKLSAMSPFDTFKHLVQDAPYNASLDYHTELFTNESMLSENSKVVQATEDFNCLPHPYNYDVVNGKPSASSFTAENYILQFSPNTYNDLCYYRDDFSHIPEVATEIEVNVWDDYAFYYLTSAYLCNVSGSYPNSGKGVIHPTVGYRESKYRTETNNDLYQKNIFIEIPITANTTYYCQNFYPVCGESDNTKGNFYGMVTSCRSTTNFTYATGNRGVHGFFSASRYTVPTITEGKAVSVTTTGKTMLTNSTISTISGRQSDFDNGNSVIDSWSPNSTRYEYYTGYSYGGTQRESRTPNVKSFTYTSSGYLYLECAVFSYDGINYSDAPKIWKL